MAAGSPDQSVKFKVEHYHLSGLYTLSGNRCIFPSVVEAYESETREIVKRFLRRRISFSGCIAALDAALAALIPRLNPEQLPALREVMLANNERVMKEMERRVSEDPS